MSSFSPSGVLIRCGHLPLNLTYFTANNSPQSSWIQGIPSPSPTPFTDIYHEEPQPTIELAQSLVDVFFSHCRQSLLGLHMGRLRESFTRPVMEQHHPVLTNAIFLWACYISRPGPLSTHESHYLSRALDSLSDALQYQSRLLDVIQASCLLSVYFLSNGRALEGSYHANAAASLAIQCGLHGAMTNRSSSFETTASISPFKLDPPKDAIEQGERILTFWQVFVLDRCWSVVLHKPVTIPHGSDGYASIIMPWPQDMEEYVAVRSVITWVEHRLTRFLRVKSMICTASTLFGASLNIKPQTSAEDFPHWLSASKRPLCSNVRTTSRQPGTNVGLFPPGYYHFLINMQL